MGGRGRGGGKRMRSRMSGAGVGRCREVVMRRTLAIKAMRMMKGEHSCVKKEQSADFKRYVHLGLYFMPTMKVLLERYLSLYYSTILFLAYMQVSIYTPSMPAIPPNFCLTKCLSM